MTRSGTPRGRRVGERKDRTTQLERIVSRSASGNEVKSRSSDPLGGFSRVLRNALADWGIIRSASAITPNLNLPDADRVMSHPRSEEHTSELQSSDHLVLHPLLPK